MAPTPPSVPLLQLDATFSNPVPAAVRRPGKSFGSGTRLGMHDSMIVSPVWDGDAEPTVLVGSAEGVVTKFRVHPTTNEVEPLAMSTSLGSGAWALGISEADGNKPGKEIVVATHRGLHILQRDTLVTLQSRRDLPWDMSMPRSMEIAEVIPGNGFAEILLVSHLGRLQIFDMKLVERFSYGEPGVVDFKVIQAGPTVELAVLTTRGHLVKLAWNTAVTPATMTLVASSQRLNGVPLDLEPCDALYPGQPRIAVAMAGTVPGHKESIWVFDTQTMLPVVQHITGAIGIKGVSDASHGTGGDLEVFGNGLIVLQGGEILVVDQNGSTTQRVALGLFPPLMGAVDLAVDQGAQRLYVSTEAGYVSWAPLTGLLSGTLSFTSTTPGRGRGVANAPPAHCNRTLSATWGMVVDNGKLQVIDQAGSRWSVDGTGNVTLEAEVGHEVPNGLFANRAPARGPFRAMRKLGGLTAMAANEAAVTSLSALPLFPVPGLSFLSPTQSLDIRTAPFEPGRLNAQGGWSYADAVVLGDSTSAWVSDPNKPQHLYVHDGLVVFPRGGDVLDLPAPQNGGATRLACWWGGEHADPAWQNRVQGVWCSPNGIANWWCSCGGTAVNIGGTSPSQTSGANILGHDLRNQVSEQKIVTDAQALRLFLDPVANAPRAALFTPGARLMVLEVGPSGANIGLPPLERDGTTQAPLDFGTGGMALAVGLPRSQDPFPQGQTPGTSIDLYVGSQAFFAALPAAGSTTAAPLVGAITRVEYTCGASLGASRLDRREQIALDNVAGHAIYGVCGMAVGEIIASHPFAELVVGTLDGHLLVYGLGGDGSIAGLLYATQVEGAVGVYNSIVFADLVGAGGVGPPDGVNELYVAGSLGLRRWM